MSGNTGITEPGDLLPAMDLLARSTLQYEVEQFLYHEAALLDARDYEAWYELIADDIHYWMPIRRTMSQKEVDQEFTRPGEMAYFDDNRKLLGLRVAKLRAGSAWSEDPPSRTRHLVSNVRIEAVRGNRITLDACFHLYRTRLHSDVDSWVGHRQDVLTRAGSSFRISQRHIFLDQTVIQAPNFSSLF